MVGGYGLKFALQLSNDVIPPSNALEHFSISISFVDYAELYSTILFVCDRRNVDLAAVWHPHFACCLPTSGDYTTTFMRWNLMLTFDCGLHPPIGGATMSAFVPPTLQD
jgi:hypothetical protein